MSEARIAAQSGVCRAGDDTLSRSNNGTDADIMHENTACQQLPWSNYCNHIPTSPDFFRLPETHKPRAKIIQETIKRLCAAYFKPKKLLNSLQYHNDTTGNQVKSQRRNAEIALLQVMIYYLDDATGRVGRRLNDGTFKDISIKKLAGYAKLRLKRAKRAMVDIVKAGYIKVTRQYTRAENGEYIGLPSIREFLPKFFIDLDVKGDLWVKWFSNKNWKKEQEAKKVTKIDRKKSRAMLGLISENMRKAGKKTMTGFSEIVKKVTGQKPSDTAHEKKLISKALELFNLDPSKSISEYMKELRARYPSGG